MKTVALTGNVASGKSTVAALWRAAGVPVIGADDLARQAVAPGSEGLRATVEAFGREVLASDGSLDRAAMRARIVRDDDARRRLEAIVHPIVAELRDAWLQEQRLAGVPLAVVEIPLLYETGGEHHFDEVVFVDAPEPIRLQRLVEDRGLDPDEARALMATQADPASKRQRADHVIGNAGSQAELEAAALALLDQWMATWPSRPPSGAPTGLPTSPAPDGFMRLDLHMHTWGSWDCLSDPESVLRQARARGVERIAITDHNRLHVALRMAERHPDAVIPGEEVKTAEGIDVIGLYLHTEIPKGTPARETIERIKQQGGIAYLPHPYAPGKGGGGRWAEELAPLCEVVEVFNARLHPRGRNDPAVDLARRCDRLVGAGSDAHTVGEVARAFVEVPRHANTAAALRMALRHARPFGVEASRLVHLASTWAKLRMKLPGAPGANG